MKGAQCSIIAEDQLTWRTHSCGAESARHSGWPRVLHDCRQGSRLCGRSPRLADASLATSARGSSQSEHAPRGSFPGERATVEACVFELSLCF